MYIKERAPTLNVININVNVLETWKIQGKLVSAKIKQKNKETMKTEDMETLKQSQFEGEMGVFTQIAGNVKKYHNI